MTATTRAAGRTVILTALAGLAVGVPAGYVAGRAGGPPPPPPPVSRTAPPVDHAAMGHGPMGNGGTAPDGAPGTSAARAFREANARMHSAMGAPSTGDVDRDFARGMVPHHQGAVEMARIELRHGTDPEMRRLATAVIETQQAEIEAMRRWIAKREAR